MNKIETETKFWTIGQCIVKAMQAIALIGAILNRDWFLVAVIIVSL